MKVLAEDGVTEIEVFTPAEVATQVAQATAKVTDELTPKITTLEADLKEAKETLSTRTGEFKQFRKLSDEQVAKLGIAEKTIYENGLAMEEMRLKSEKATKDAQEATVNNLIRNKVGTDEKLFTKVKDMYSLIGTEAITPEQISSKILSALGAISATEPDLIAGVAGFTGGYRPPVSADDKKGFGETERGKAGANELGLTLEPKK